MAHRVESTFLKTRNSVCVGDAVNKCGPGTRHNLFIHLSIRQTVLLA